MLVLFVNLLIIIKVSTLLTNVIWLLLVVFNPNAYGQTSTHDVHVHNTINDRKRIKILN